jgi:hypothetical protein
MLAEGAGNFTSSQPELRDFPFLLRGSKGELHETDPNALLALACKRGWTNTCKPLEH